MTDPQELALAKVGIIALIDEATGYQQVREPDALRQILREQGYELTKIDQKGACDEDASRSHRR